MTLQYHYIVPGDDFVHAGEASGHLKGVLRQLGYPGDAIRRVAVSMYEGEINMVIHANGGEIEKTDEWGRKKLAYPIQKKSTGFYQLIEFKAEPQVIEKLEINFRRDERVIRFLTFKMDKYAAEYAAKRRNVKSTKKED